MGKTIVSNVVNYNSLIDYYNSVESKLGVIEMAGSFEDLFTLIKSFKYDGISTSKIYNNQGAPTGRSCVMYVYVDGTEIPLIKNIMLVKHKFNVVSFN